MKTDKNLKEFIEYLKNHSPEIPAEIMILLIDSGKTSPFVTKRSFQPQRFKQFINPLKLFVIIAPIVLLTSVFLILNQEHNKESINLNDTVQFINPQIKIEHKIEMEGTLSRDSTDANPFDPVRGKSAVKVQESLNVNDTTREPDNTLGLSSDVFKCLGFTFNQGGFSYIFKFHWEWIKFNFGGPDEEGVFPARGIENQKDSLAPVIYLLASQNINQHLPNCSTRKILFAISPVDSMVDGIPLNAVFDLCLPIKVVDSTLSKKIQEYVFWVYPNERFFQCLPVDISTSLRKEFNYQKQRMNPETILRLGGSATINKGIADTDTRKLNGSIVTDNGGIKSDSSIRKTELETEPVPCVYYPNLCETLSGLEYVNLYPNPATDNLNVDLIIQKAKKIRFRIFNLEGRVISDEGSPENYPEAGRFKHQMDISKLKPGFYLLIMTDTEGSKITKSFIKN